jgi:uncharacterized protein DUF5724/uncharacterized protein DUF4132
MLSKEEANERLKAFYDPDHAAHQIARLEKLPDKLSTLGQIMIQAGPAWVKLEKDFNSRKKFRQDLFGDIVKFNAQERKALFSALFPGIATYIEETWKLFDLLPYQSGYHRRPFRQSESTNAQAKVAWVMQLPFALRGYENQDVIWLAAWAAHLNYWGSNSLGYLFAAAIEQGGEIGNEVFNVLIASANGTHETGMMGRHVVRGLLCASRVDGWEYVERLLLAAQREEGLRQVILEAIDESHPLAFRRILRLVVDQNLIRFSATIRALSVWFGLPLEAIQPTVTRAVLEQVLQYLDSLAACEQAVQIGDAEEAYYALWAMAFEDVLVALPHALALSNSSSVEKRFAAIHMLGQIGLKEGLPELLKALDDEDLRVTAHAFAGITSWHYEHDLLASSDLFEHLERLLPHVKHKQNTLKPLVWDWLPITLDRELVSGRLIDCLGTRSPKRLIPFLGMMNPSDRARVATVLNESKHKDEETLQTLLLLAGDLSTHVRETALKGLRGIKLRDADIARLEELLSRQSQDLRRGILQLLLELSDKKLLESIQRLIEHKGENQHFAALELMKECKQNARVADQVQLLALQYKQRMTSSAPEIILLNEILAESIEKYSLEDALGLLNPQNRTQPKPVKPSISSSAKLSSPAAVACLKSLDALIEEHRNDVINCQRGNTQATELLGNIHSRWMLYSNLNWQQPRDFSTFHLKELAEAWWQTRSDDLRDDDGCELMRALVAVSLFVGSGNDYFQHEEKGISNDIQNHFEAKLDFGLHYKEIIHSIVEWLVWAHPIKGEADFLLDALEKSVERIPFSELTKVEETYGGRKTRHRLGRKLCYLTMARWQRDLRPETWTDQHHARLWEVICWLNEPIPGLPGSYAVLEDALYAYQAQAATRDDLLYMFLGPRKENGYGPHFGLLAQFSGRKLQAKFEPQFEKFPIIQEIVEMCRERIIEVEFKRGELPTAATAAAMSLRSMPGMKNLFRLLVALRDTDFERGYMHGQSRSGVFSHLIRNSYPVENDTLDKFVKQVDVHQIPQRRLIELAVYAPQWASFVEHTIGWEHLTDAVWWLYAHTKDRQWTVEASIHDEWVARISEHTPLSASDLMDGAVDVAWFKRVYAEMGETRWQQLYEAALYTSGGIGHGRARLFADAMLGNVSVEKESERIKKKRNQDSVRALGLIPLNSEKEQTAEVLNRYEVMQEFLRTGKKFGSMRKASEKLAVSIGMQNLARTAGYVDPQRLEWAMEVEAVADLSMGPIQVSVEEFHVVLSIDDLGEPAVEFRKKDKLIKTLPSHIKKHNSVAELLNRKQQLDRQVSRMRLSLEQAMCRGDEFTVAELKSLFRHPMLKAMIEQLIFVSPEGLGYPIQSGTTLVTHEAKKISLMEADHVRIAHPLDLLENKEWHRWQQDCFIAERIQPFKQVFRELYVLTSTEKGEGNLSRRYAGQQVNPRQAVALFGTHGWVVDPNEGVQKTFHQEGISARVGFLQGAFTPAEVEGVTIEAVVFTKRGEWQALKLEEVPARIFSEVMRDLDLVVSVAHAGGIDPESSASSIEARSALVRETTSLLKLNNVQLSQQHVIIDGKLSNYNVNLGSGVVHKQPGGALCIIPVHSQQRGRIFLPFVDNDPKTAEIVSKVILLARDDQIKDPTILEQIL